MPRSFVYLLNSVDFEELGGSYAILGSIAFWGGMWIKLCKFFMLIKI